VEDEGPDGPIEDIAGYPRPHNQPNPLPTAQPLRPLPAVPTDRDPTKLPGVAVVSFPFGGRLGESPESTANICG
jgi:hypothetical protein